MRAGSNNMQVTPTEGEKGANMIKKAKKSSKKHNKKQTVVIEIFGGVAEVTKCPTSVSVKIIDHDVI